MNTTYSCVSATGTVGDALLIKKEKAADLDLVKEPRQLLLSLAYTNLKAKKLRNEVARQASNTHTKCLLNGFEKGI